MFGKLIFTALFILSCQYTFAQNVSSATIDDDEIDLVPNIDSVLEKNSKTGKMFYRKICGRYQIVEYRSGKQIFKENEAAEPVIGKNKESIEPFLKKIFADELAETKDYMDFIMVLIDSDGNVDMLNTNFLIATTQCGDDIHKGLWSKLENLEFTPARKDGKPVPYLVTISGPERKMSK